MSVNSVTWPEKFSGGLASLHAPLSAKRDERTRAGAKPEINSRGPRLSEDVPAVPL